MTLKQLRYFLALSELLSYTKTAEMFYISQPGLSATIKELEKEIGTNLFERDKRSNSISLTEAGQLFCNKISNAISEIDNAVEAVNDYCAHMQSSLKIGYIHTYNVDSLKHIFTDFERTIGGDSHVLKREIFASNRLLQERVLSRKLNFGFALSVCPGLASIQAGQQELFVAVSKEHPFGNREVITFDELKREPCIRVARAMEINRRVDELYMQYNCMPIVYTSSVGNIGAALTYVLEYNCYTIVPELSTWDYSRISLLKIQDHPLIRPIHLVWKEDCRLTEMEKTFIDYMTEQSSRFLP